MTTNHAHVNFTKKEIYHVTEKKNPIAAEHHL